MRKDTTILSFLVISFLFTSCFSDSISTQDINYFEKIQGKWKLTENISSGSDIIIPVIDGYEIELKNDHTFTSNEVAGYTGGIYAVIYEPGRNIKLTYKNGSDSRVMYKYITGEYADNALYIEPVSETITSDATATFSGDILTRIP